MTVFSVDMNTSEIIVVRSFSPTIFGQPEKNRSLSPRTCMKRNNRNNGEFGKYKPTAMLRFDSTTPGMHPNKNTFGIIIMETLISIRLTLPAN